MRVKRSRNYSGIPSRGSNPDLAWVRALQLSNTYGSRAMRVSSPFAFHECRQDQSRRFDAIKAPGHMSAIPFLMQSGRIKQHLGSGYLSSYLSSDICFREKKDLESPADLIVSPYDTEARFSVKCGMEWIGYKVHFTETCDDDMPHLITHVETTTASVPDDQVLESVHQALAQREVLPSLHLVDAGYTDAEGLVSSQRDYGVTLMGPVAADPSWQAKAGEGFDKASFLIDWEREIVICPAGKQNYSWLPNGDRSRGVVGGVRVQFASRDCTPCPLRLRCTRAKIAPRELVLLPRDRYEALRAAKQRQNTEAFREAYALRAGIESTHAQWTR